MPNDLRASLERTRARNAQALIDRLPFDRITLDFSETPTSVFGGLEVTERFESAAVVTEYLRSDRGIELALPAQVAALTAEVRELVRAIKEA